METLSGHEGVAGLPDAVEVNKAFRRMAGEEGLLSGDFERFKGLLDRVAPVQLHFVPTVAPDVGIAPANIRDQWVGLRLPVRSKQYDEESGEEGFVVRSREALEILKIERPEAYQWWQEHYVKERAEVNADKKAAYEKNYQEPWPEDREDPLPLNPDFPEYGSNMDWFIFLPKWGIAVAEPKFRDNLTEAEPLYP